MGVAQLGAAGMGTSAGVGQGTGLAPCLSPGEKVHVTIEGPDTQTQQCVQTISG